MFGVRARVGGAAKIFKFASGERERAKSGTMRTNKGSEKAR